MTRTVETEPQCSAESRRFSPDMEKRWLPTVDGKVIVGGEIPFSGFNLRRDAVVAAKRFCDAR